MVTTDFLARLEGVKRNGSGWMAKCPAHKDRQASLKVDEADDKILIHCHAGCTPFAVTGALGLDMTDLWLEPRRERPASYRPPEPEPKPDAEPTDTEEVYEYTDGLGRVIFEVCRLPDKKFLQRLPGSEEWGGVSEIEEKPLYHLPQLLTSLRETPRRRVWIVEGEKDVHAIERAGGVATCNAGGAGKWSPHYVTFLQGAVEIRVVADKDEAGLGHAYRVSESLGDIPHEIVQAKEGKDAHDHLAAGGTLNSFTPIPKSRGGVPLMRGDMVFSEDVKWIPEYEDYIPFGGITHLAGMPGCNKSTFTCRIAADVTKLGLSVFFITSEDSTDAVIVPRLIAAGADLTKVFIANKHLTIPHDLAGIEQNVEHERVRLLIIDPIDAHLDTAVDSFKSQSIRGALAPLAFLASRLNCAVILVGHPNKGTRKDPMLRVGGSIGIPGIARSALMMGNHPDHPMEAGMRVVSAYKGNWSQRPKSRIYRIELGARAGRSGSRAWPMRTSPPGSFCLQARPRRTNDQVRPQADHRRGPPLEWVRRCVRDPRGDGRPESDRPWR